MIKQFYFKQFNLAYQLNLMIPSIALYHEKFNYTSGIFTQLLIN